MGDPRWTDPDVPELMDFLHIAWGIIANAADWRLDDKQNHEWVKAAERWRDQYHDLLPVSPDTPTPTGQDQRSPECVKAWPDCVDGDYNPACCRFPKSCSCGPT